MAAPFERAFEDFANRQEEASKFTSESAPEGIREGGEVMAIHYRDEEAIYIKASHDRVTVIFSTIFREETDRIFGKVFLQEFVDARRRAIQNAPQVLFRNEPPLELQGVRGLADGSHGEVGYVTFGMAILLGSIITAYQNQFFSHGTLPPSGGKRRSPTSRHSEITFITTSKLPRSTQQRPMQTSWRTNLFYQAFIHSRMRRRTADFLQGEASIATRKR